jgi:transposase-like protein
MADEVKGLVEEWRSRPLEVFYPVIFFGALRVSIRNEGHASKKVAYLALAIRLDGQKELLDRHLKQAEKQGCTGYVIGCGGRVDRFSRCS